MAVKKEEEAKKEYTKAKPFSREGRMRASKVALGMIKGQPESVRAKGQAARDERKAVGDQKRASTEKARATAHASKQKTKPKLPPGGGGKPKIPLKK